LSVPMNSSDAHAAVPSPIAGTVLPIQRAEELLATLPGVVSARIVATAGGMVDEIHVLTTNEVAAKQTVRNIESALIAHLGMRVSHKKISVATSSDPVRPIGPRASTPIVTPTPSDMPPRIPRRVPSEDAQVDVARRRLYFEDVEVRRSRSKGVACRVTLRKGDTSFVGEAEGLENERLRIELAARATLLAILQAEGETRSYALDGCRTVEAFDREFVFVGITAKAGRESVLLGGTAEIRDSAETASVLAVLDATNRWMELDR
jgi:hypothetical protein